LAKVSSRFFSDDQSYSRRRSLRALEWLNFFVADVQTGVGPFLAAYLASQGWNPGKVGYALTFGGLVTVALQLPAGAVIDAVHRKRALLATIAIALTAGALAMAWKTTVASVGMAQFLIGGSGAFIGPLLAAITLGMVGKAAFDQHFGRNQAFNSAGNVFTASLMAAISYTIGNRAIFVAAAALAIPTLIVLGMIDGGSIDYRRARGAEGDRSGQTEENTGLRHLFSDRVLLVFLVCALLFHLANAAMLPELGEMLSKGHGKAAVPFMSACIIVTQLVITLSASSIGKAAARYGRKPFLLAGFGVLPVRGVLYTLTHLPSALIAIQVLDGIANAIFGVVSILVIADRTRGTGRFNLAQGALATMVGIGAALSNAIGGQLVQRLGFRASFLGLAAIAGTAVVLLYLAIPETLRSGDRPDHCDPPGAAAELELLRSEEV
jgi:MFS family permease